MPSESFNQATLKTPEGAVKLMESSQSQKEWDDNCSAVKKANAGNYPAFWYEEITYCGVEKTTKAKFNL